jgi:hypothetical protein
MWECQVATTGFEPVTKGFSSDFDRFLQILHKRAIWPLSPCLSFYISAKVNSSSESTLWSLYPSIPSLLTHPIFDDFAFNMQTE